MSRFRTLATAAAATIFLTPQVHAATRTFEAVVDGLWDFGAFAMLGFGPGNPAPDSIAFRFSYDDAVLLADVPILDGGVAVANRYERPSTLLSFSIGGLTLLPGMALSRFNKIHIYDDLPGGTAATSPETLSYIYDGAADYPTLSNGIILDRFVLNKFGERAGVDVFSGPDAYTAANLDTLPNIGFAFIFRDGANTATITSLSSNRSNLTITEIAAVPLPLSGLMLLAGLGTFGVVRRRRHCVARHRDCIPDLV